MSFDEHRYSAARLTVLSGPSGVGKGSVKALIRERYPWVWFSVSATTRSPRPDEIPGFHYHYYDRAHFEKLAGDGQFLEWAQYANNLYGTPRGPVEDRLSQGYPAVMEADLQGARQVRKAMPQAQLVFLAPPSWDELVRRLKGRGTEDPETIKRRLTLAEEELAAESEFDHTIVNHSVEQATEELVSLLGSPVQSSAACPATNH
ncbi:MAG TPA: guanylate kinase [Candidatus Stackebrandtia excrementipullorum]|nr:guanylate kinase [Candidatus Stackebrandtia excrementipullorum]